MFLDTEATGLDPARDALVEVALVREERGVVSVFSSLVRADIASSPAAAAVHGISADELVHAPPFEEIAARVAGILHGGVPVAHGASLDLALLTRALESAGCDASPLRFAIDTVVLARRAVPAPRYTLSALTKQLGLPAQGWHRAAADVDAVRALFARLAPEFAPVSPRDLWEVRAGQREAVRVRRAIAARLEDLVRTRTRCALIVRSRSKPAMIVRGVIERWASPHAFVRTSRASLRVVRADRILRVEPA